MADPGTEGLYPVSQAVDIHCSEIGTNAERKDSKTDGRYIVLTESKTRIVLSYHPYIFQIFHLLPMLSIISQQLSHCIPIYATNHNLILPHYTNK